MENRRNITLDTIKADREAMQTQVTIERRLLAMMNASLEKFRREIVEDLKLKAEQEAATIIY